MSEAIKATATETVEAEATAQAVYDIPESAIGQVLENDENVFIARNPATGQTFRLPKLGFLPRKSAKFIAKAIAEKIDEADVMRKLVEMNAPEAFEDFDDLEEDQVIYASNEWVKASGIDLGESETSSDE